MIKRVRVLVALAVFVVTACAAPPQPTAPSPTLSPSPSVLSPSPTVSPTPSQAELSAEAERVYRAFFTEWKRLQFQGGSEEPTQVLLDHGAEGYLESVMLLLRDQKNREVTTWGSFPTARVRPIPGHSEDGGDPRYTIAVCEDHSASFYEDEEGVHSGQIVQGELYLREVDGRIKVVSGTTNVVVRCDF